MNQFIETQNEWQKYSTMTIDSHDCKKIVTEKWEIITELTSLAFKYANNNTYGQSKKSERE